MLSSEPGGAAGRAQSAPQSAPYYLAVDRQLKLGFDTYEKAEQAALTIKQEHPRLLVTVYETKLRRHIAIEPPRMPVAFDGKKAPSAVPSHPASTTRH